MQLCQITNPLAPQLRRAGAGHIELVTEHTSVNLSNALTLVVSELVGADDGADEVVLIFGQAFRVLDWE